MKEGSLLENQKNQRSLFFLEPVQGKYNYQLEKRHFFDSRPFQNHALHFGYSIDFIMGATIEYILLDGIGWNWI